MNARRNGETKRLRNKMSTTKSGQGAECQQPHWPFWSAMKFYYNYDKAKSTSSVSSLQMVESPIYTPECLEPSSSSNSNVKEKKVIAPEEALQVALKALAEEDDKWHAFGMYLAAQLRDMAKNNNAAANKLQISIMQQTMDAIADLTNEK